MTKKKNQKGAGRKTVMTEKEKKKGRFLTPLKALKDI